MCDNRIIQLSEVSRRGSFFKIEREHLEHCRVNIIDQSIFDDLLITMRYYAPPSPEAYSFFHFREIFFHRGRHSGIGKSKSLRFTSCFCYHHWNTIDAIFSCVKIIKTILEPEIVYDQQKCCDPNSKTENIDR